MAQDGFKPAKFFSIDRVFRNEAVDRTHLAEFHQVEGVICDKGLTLGDLIGVLYQFFARLGMTQLRFKPAFNPYTEPSMEIFAYHPMLKKWVEVGNSGMFRPEMMLPMGMPEDVNVIAWGLSLERRGHSSIQATLACFLDFCFLFPCNPIRRTGCSSLETGACFLRCFFLFCARGISQVLNDKADEMRL